MSRKDKYKLVFSKVVSKTSFRVRCFCESTISDNTSDELATLLNVISDREGEFLLEELNLALSGGDYEEFYTPDGVVMTNDGVQITPPNVIINDSAELPLSEFKLLVEEWVEFCKSN
jgi:hypothetical protein